MTAERTLYRYRFGTAEFDEVRFELRVDGVLAVIQRRPLEVLALLLQRAGEIVTRDDLQRIIWKKRVTVENVIDTALTKLRGALGASNADLILTQPRVGFLLTGPIERTALGRQFTSALRLLPGQPVPRRETFILCSRLGQSPHHEVWLARHRKTQESRVFKFATDGEGLAALKREVTVGRVLRRGLGERPDFVRVLDWNFEVAPYFLESEEGGDNLLEWGRRHLAERGLPQRLEVFTALARAVAAAHSVGVLHKDLKPANILVTESESGFQVCLADFGSARLVEPDRLRAFGITQLGLTVTQGVMSDATAATALYIAPERLAGAAATVGGDVFSLGIILYQLVIGNLRKPLFPGWEREVPDSLLREDIAAATQGDPTHRLSSATLLVERLLSRDQRAQDVARAVAAERNAREIAEALQRSRARRPWIGAAFFSLVAGLAVSLFYHWRAGLEGRRAEREAARSAAVIQFMNEDLLRAADPTAPGSVADPRLLDILARAADRLRGDSKQDPLTKASIFHTLGQTYAGLGDYASAESQLRQAIDSASRDSDGAVVRARAEYSLANVLLSVSRFPEASALLDRADQDAATELARPTPLAVTAHFTRGSYEDDVGHETRALAEFEAADRVRQQAAPQNLLLLFQTRQALIDAYIAAHKFDAAKRAATPLLAKEFSDTAVGVKSWSQVRTSFADILAHEHDYRDAITLDQEALKVLRQRLGGQHFYVGFALSELASVYVDSGDLQLALDTMKEAYSVLKAALGPDSQDTLGARGNVAILEAQTGDTDAAVGDLTDCRERLIKMLGADSPQTEFMSYYLALSLSDRGRESQAWDIVTTLSPAVLNDAGEGGDDWPERLQALRGKILIQQGHTVEGRNVLSPALHKMESDHLQDWLLNPFRAVLTEARR